MEKEQQYKGKISFINFEKHFATIDYLYNNKQKSVNCRTNEADSSKKTHQYRLGDVVSFELKLSDRGDKMTAFNIKYLHNIEINLLIERAVIENRFTGYLKKVEDKYFVKEVDSYILFPLQLSPWENEPAATAENVAISFKLTNTDKPASVGAELFSHAFIPEYKMALEHYNNELPIESTVYKISPFAVYVQFFNEKIRAKLPANDFENESLKEGDIIPVKIVHLTTSKIAIKNVKG